MRGSALNEPTLRVSTHLSAVKTDAVSWIKEVNKNKNRSELQQINDINGKVYGNDPKHDGDGFYLVKTKAALIQKTLHREEMWV